jgi:LysM repeat protein
MSKVEFDLSSMSRRDVILIIISGAIILGVVTGLIIFLTQRQQGAGPKPTLAAGSPVPTVTLIAGAVTPSPALPPTTVPTIGPTPTLEPYAHTVEEGQTLFAIIQFYGYRDLSVIPELVRINNMVSENQSLQAGQILYIPRQTPTPGPTLTATPEGATAGPTVDYTGCSVDKRCTSPDGQFYVHEVQPGDDCLSIAFQYNTRFEDFMAANGLTECSIFPGQKMNVPILVTMTPTLTPTGGPDSTATPTPTLSSPSLLVPPNTGTVARSQPVILQWATVHALSTNQNYLVVVTNLSSGDEFRAITRANTYRLPDNIRPGIGQSARYEWQILVISGSSTSAQPLSGQDVKWSFTWGP